MKISSVAPDNSRVLTVKLGHETSLVAYSTDKRSTICKLCWVCKNETVRLYTIVLFIYAFLCKCKKYIFVVLSGCIALAVYNTRSPPAYEALRGLKILQLLHSKTLKQIIKDGSENAGIDEEYLLGQHKTYVNYQKKREEEGHPRPLGLGVMMWDEVKVRAEMCILISKLLKILIV